MCEKERVEETFQKQEQDSLNKCTNANADLFGDEYREYTKTSMIGIPGIRGYVQQDSKKAD